MKNGSLHHPLYFSKGLFIGKKRKELSLGQVAVSETIYDHDTCSEWHSHESFRISYVLAGGTTEKRKDSKCDYRAGDLMFYYPGLIHQNINYQKGTRILNVEMGRNFLDSALLTNYSFTNIAFRKEHQCKIIFYKIFREFVLADHLSSLSLNQLCFELVQPHHYDAHSKPLPNWAKKMYELLHDYSNIPFSLQELSLILNVHPVTISKRFSIYFGCTLGEYLRRIKIDKAISLMHNSTYSLTEIAYECGFSDQSHFTKTFYRITGFLPKEYKRM